jgi:sRNA-binding protein
MSRAGEVQGSWLQAYFADAVARKLCVTIHCTTCGAREFRLGLLRQLAIHGGEPENRGLSLNLAKVLIRALGTIQPVKQDEERWEEAMRCVLFDVWSAWKPVVFSAELVPMLAGTWAGEVLDRMEQHYLQRQAEAQRWTEVENPEAVARRREEKRRLKEQRHAERLEAKKERDRVWREEHQRQDDNKS